MLIEHIFIGKEYLEASRRSFDLRRLNMLLAVLDKRFGFRFGSKDVFLNIAGGLRVDDPATDLAVVVALLSSYEDKPISMDACFTGEVGLSGEVRAVNRIEQRMIEASKLGYAAFYVSKYNVLPNKNNKSVVVVKSIQVVYRQLFD